MNKSVYFLKPSGFCLGVEGAIKTLNKILEENPSKNIYCIHEIVHNPSVINFFVGKGIVFVDSIDEISDNNSIVVFSAHGANRVKINEAKERFFKVYNLECPLVTKVYKELESFGDIDILFYIGKAGHAEANGVTDYAKYLRKKVYIFQGSDYIPKVNSKSKIGVLSQTTLNFSSVNKLFGEINTIYPNAKFPPISDVCKATFDRQSVIINNSKLFDTIIIIGGKASSNTRELCKIGENSGKKVFFGESLEEILETDGKRILNSNNIGVTGGASTPYEDIKKAFDWCVENGYKGKVFPN